MTSAAYDLSGNVTSWAGQTFEHDPFNMVHQSGAWRYIYGPGDERIWTIYAPSPDASTWTETWTLRGLGGQLLREYQVVGGNSAGNWSWTEDSIHRDGLVLAMATPSETRPASLDHLGSPRLWTGAGGTIRSRPIHLPYGEAAVASSEKLQFTGHERDAREAGATDDLGLFEMVLASLPINGGVEYGRCVEEHRLDYWQVIAGSAVPKRLVPPGRVVRSADPLTSPASVVAHQIKIRFPGSPGALRFARGLRTTGKAVGRVATPLTVAEGLYDIGVLGYCGFED